MIIQATIVPKQEKTPTSSTTITIGIDPNNKEDGIAPLLPR
jgi:hypothetical protein